MSVYNRLELLLLTGEYYDDSFQAFKKYGLYIYSFNEFFLYNAGDITEKRLMKFVDNVINYRVEVIDPNSSFYTERYFHNSCDYFEDDFIVFYFSIVDEGDEHLIIPKLTDEISSLKCIKIAATFDGRVLTENETKKLIEENDKIQHIKNLESIANWKPSALSDPHVNIFADWSISSFADEHFGRNCIDIKQKYRELAKVHHPDKGGDELMFKAITKAKEYLVQK